MTRVLADMALDVAAATGLVFRLASSFDKAGESPEEAAFARVMTPVVKYWVCKIAPSLIFEAMECIGGSGYIEERPIARHYREAPVNAIWEGSGNVMALDVLRVLRKGKDLFEAVFAMISRDLGPTGPGPSTYARRCIALRTRRERRAPLRRATRHGRRRRRASAHRGRRIADAYAESRLATGWRYTYGMLDMRFDARLLWSCCIRS